MRLAIFVCFLLGCCLYASDNESDNESEKSSVMAKARAFLQKSHDSSDSEESTSLLSHLFQRKHAASAGSTPVSQHSYTSGGAKVSEGQLALLQRAQDSDDSGEGSALLSHLLRRKHAASAGSTPVSQHSYTSGGAKVSEVQPALGQKNLEVTHIDDDDMTFSPEEGANKAHQLEVDRDKQGDADSGTTAIDDFVCDRTEEQVPKVSFDQMPVCDEEPKPNLGHRASGLIRIPVTTLSRKGFDVQMMQVFLRETNMKAKRIKGLLWRSSHMQEKDLAADIQKDVSKLMPRVSKALQDLAMKQIAVLEDQAVQEKSVLEGPKADLEDMVDALGSSWEKRTGAARAELLRAGGVSFCEAEAALSKALQFSCLCVTAGEVVDSFVVSQSEERHQRLSVTLDMVEDALKNHADLDRVRVALRNDTDDDSPLSIVKQITGNLMSREKVKICMAVQALQHAVSQKKRSFIREFRQDLERHFWSEQSSKKHILEKMTQAVVSTATIENIELWWLQEGVRKFVAPEGRAKEFQVVSRVVSKMGVAHAPTFRVKDNALFLEHYSALNGAVSLDLGKAVEEVMDCVIQGFLDGIGFIVDTLAHVSDRNRPGAEKSTERLLAKGEFSSIIEPYMSKDEGSEDLASQLLQGLLVKSSVEKRSLYRNILRTLEKQGKAFDDQFRSSLLKHSDELQRALVEQENLHPSLCCISKETGLSIPHVVERITGMIDCVVLAKKRPSQAPTIEQPRAQQMERKPGQRCSPRGLYFLCCLGFGCCCLEPYCIGCCADLGRDYDRWREGT